MSRLLIFIGFFAFACSSQAQIIDLGTCHPDSLSKQGFAEFGKMIGDTRMLIIGEQEHGVGTGYESFAHIVKYLHEEKGFNLILHEFCFYSFGAIQKNSSNNSAQQYRKAMYWPQAKAKEYDLLLDYIDVQKQTDHPLIMEGFDSRIFLRKSFYEYCDSLLSSNPNLIQAKEIPSYLQTLDRLLKLEYKDSISSLLEKENFLIQTQTISQRIALINPDIRQQQIFKNLIGFAKNAWNFEGYKITDVDRFYNRELQMADNIYCLAETLYPTEKIIVYMHNGHAAKNFQALTGAIPDSAMLKTKNLGTLINEHYGDDCLHIGTTFYSGTYCKWDYLSKKIPKPQSKSLEAELHKKGLRYAYLGLKKNKKYDLFFNDFNTWMAGGIVKGVFGQLFDGYIYIDKGEMPIDKTASE